MSCDSLSMTWQEELGEGLRGSGPLVLHGKGPATPRQQAGEPAEMGCFLCPVGGGAPLLGPAGHPCTEEAARVWVEKPEPSLGRVDGKVLWRDCSHEPSAPVLTRALRSHVQLRPCSGPVHGQPRPLWTLGLFHAASGARLSRTTSSFYTQELRPGWGWGITSPRHTREQALNLGPLGPIGRQGLLAP